MCLFICVYKQPLFLISKKNDFIYFQSKDKPIKQIMQKINQLKMTKPNRIENISAIEEYGDDYLIYYDGSKYKGDLKTCENSDSIRDGYGSMTYSDGVSSYIGYYKNNEKHGYGKYKFKNEYTYEGEFKNGIKCGKGKYIYKNEYIYEGEFENDVKCGKGKFISFNENMNFTYEGEFKNDVRWGKGKNVSHNGNITIIYEGEWEDDLKHGYGKYSYKELYDPNPNPNPNPNSTSNPDQDFYEEEYEGFWKNNNKDGKGEIKIKGLWRDDSPISSIEIEKNKNINNYIYNKIQEKVDSYKRSNESYCKEAFYNMFPPGEKYEFY